MENTEMKVESVKVESLPTLQDQIEYVDWDIETLIEIENVEKFKEKVQRKIAIAKAIKENLIAIRNIQSSGQTLADKEREAGVSFDSMVAVFKCFIEDVWKMRYAQKDKTANAKQLAAYEQEIDEQLAILVPERKSETILKVLGQEGEDYQLNN